MDRPQLRFVPCSVHGVRCTSVRPITLRVLSDGKLTGSDLPLEFFGDFASQRNGFFRVEDMQSRLCSMQERLTLHHNATC